MKQEFNHNFLRLRRELNTNESFFFFESPCTEPSTQEDSESIRYNSFSILWDPDFNLSFPLTLKGLAPSLSLG